MGVVTRQLRHSGHPGRPGQHIEKRRKCQISPSGKIDRTCVSSPCFREGAVGAVPTLGQGVSSGALSFVREPQIVFHRSPYRCWDRSQGPR